MSNAQTPLTPAMFHVLLALAGEDLHGYAILKEVPEFPADIVRKYRHQMIVASAILQPDGKLEQVAIRQSPEQQLAELECHLGAGTDAATALAAVDRSPAPNKPGRRSAGWQMGLLIGVAIGILAMLLGLL